MKYALMLIFATLFLNTTSFAHEKNITEIRLGVKVTIQLPTEVLENASIERFSNPDSLFIRRKDGSYINITPITKELLSLSDSFNLRDYPKYILWLSEPDFNSGLSIADIENLKQARMIWKQDRSTQPEASIYKHGTRVYYTLCEDYLCRNFVVENAQPEEIILLEVYGIDNKAIIGVIAEETPK